MKRLTRILFTIVFILGFAVSGCDKDSQQNNQAYDSPTQNQSITVHITRTGKKYHMAGCRYLSHSDIPIDLKKAKEMGYTPCSVCNPPQ
jgi:hypothetical protein